MRARRVVVLLALATIGLTVGSSARASAAATVNVPSSIDGSGRVDVTAELGQFLASVQPGATVAFPKDADYRIDGVLRIKDLRNVTLDGNGSTLFAPTDGRDVSPPRGLRSHWPRSRQHVAIRNVDSLVVQNLAVRGPNRNGDYVPTLEGQAGFAIAASSHVVLDRVSVSNTYGDGVYIAGKASDVTVRGSEFDKIGRQGIAIVNASNVVVDGNRFRDIARSVVDVEPAVPRWSVGNVHIRKNEMANFGNFALAAGGAGARVSDVWFENNHITGGNGIAVFARAPRTPRTGLHIIGNTSDVVGRLVKGAQQSGVMQITRIDGVEIVGNRQRVVAGAAAVAVDGVCHLDMHDNAFSGGRQERQVVAACGAQLSPGSKTKGASRGSSARRSGSTDTTWIIVGSASGVALLGVLVGLLWRDRRRSTV